MTLEAKILAAGPGWHVREMVCTAGPHDPRFEERHDTVCVAAVLAGTFQYRTTQGTALLAPGAVLLGNYACSFECSHDHGVGDRCISAHFAPEQWEAIVAATPGVREARFTTPTLPPLPALLPETAALQAARDLDAHALEEAALLLAGAVVRTQVDARASRRERGSRHEGRIADALRRIEAAAHDRDEDAVSLHVLAREAGMSRYHFLRTFSAIVGLTPHQYVLRMRMQRAAVRLRLSNEPVSAVALEAGFNDLSTFNRRFRDAMGTSPSAYRGKR